jgi:hypothetical protein
MQGKKLPEPSASAKIYLGIDACKAWLDVYLHPLGQRLRDNGKAAKLAHTAVMRKLVVLANTLVREDRLWQSIHP